MTLTKESVQKRFDEYDEDIRVYTLVKHERLVTLQYQDNSKRIVVSYDGIYFILYDLNDLDNWLSDCYYHYHLPSNTSQNTMIKDIYLYAFKKKWDKFRVLSPLDQIFIASGMYGPNPEQQMDKRTSGEYTIDTIRKTIFDPNKKLVPKSEFTAEHLTQCKTKDEVNKLLDMADCSTEREIDKLKQEVQKKTDELYAKWCPMIMEKIEKIAQKHYPDMPYWCDTGSRCNVVLAMLEQFDKDIK